SDTVGMMPVALITFRTMLRRKKDAVEAAPEREEELRKSREDLMRVLDSALARRADSRPSIHCGSDLVLLHAQPGNRHTVSAISRGKRRARHHRQCSGCGI